MTAGKTAMFMAVDGYPEEVIAEAGTLKEHATDAVRRLQKDELEV